MKILTLCTSPLDTASDEEYFNAVVRLVQLRLLILLLSANSGENVVVQCCCSLLLLIISSIYILRSYRHSRAQIIFIT